jgi:hypothetical protein
MNDANERFLEAVKSFQKLEKAARSGSAGADEKSFRKVIIDLDAAIPGLEGLHLGRAMLLKAQSLWWIYFLGLNEKNIFGIINNPEKKNQLLAESHELALKGKNILVNHNASDREISWADDLFRKTMA